MAVKKRPAGQAESKPALIITLVFFVLLSIGALVWGYFGYDGQEQLRIQAAEAKKEVEVQKKEQQWQQLQALFYKMHSGLAKDTEVAEKYDVLRKQYDNAPQTLVSAGGAAEAEKAEFDAQIAKVEADAPKGLGNGREPMRNKTTFIDRLEAAKRERDEAAKKRDEEVQAAAAAKQAQDAAEKQFIEAKKVYDKNLADAKAEAAKEKAARSQEFKDVVAMNEQLQKERDAAREAGAKREKELKEELGKLTKLKEDQDIKIAKLEEKIAGNGVKLGDLDLPKGQIVSVDPTATMVSINLGTYDKVKEGLTFSVSSPGDASKTGGKPKATVEVVRVVDPHLSRAKVTGVVDRFRDPVLKGDLLYNLAWNPNIREHVAIAGLIDLHGDGKDSTAEFVQQLQRQYNIEVDAYLDLKDLSAKGRGMSLQTTYLILGPRPDLESSLQNRDSDGRTERKEKIIGEISKMELEAKRLGIETISARRFMARIGYRLPKSAQSEGQANYEVRGVSNTGSGNAQPNPAGK